MTATTRIVLALLLLAAVGCTEPDYEDRECSVQTECTLEDDRAGWGYQGSGYSCRAGECFCGATCGQNDDCDSECCIEIVNTTSGATIGHACAPGCFCDL